MTILGFTLNSIEAHIDEDKMSGRDIKINSTPTVESIEKKELNIPNFKEALAIKFTFETQYGEDAGKIKLRGEVLFHSSDMDEILKEWKEKKVKDQVGLEVLNAVMRKSLIQAVYLADLLRLPPPIAFPIVQKGSAPTKKKKEVKREDITKEEAAKKADKK